MRGRDHVMTFMARRVLKFVGFAQPSVRYVGALSESDPDRSWRRVGRSLQGYRPSPIAVASVHLRVRRCLQTMRQHRLRSSSDLRC